MPSCMGDSPGWSLSDLHWSFNTVETGALSYHAVDDGTVYTSLRILMPERAESTFKLGTYIAIVRCDKEFIVRSTDIRALQSHLELIASSIRRVALAMSHTEYAQARASQSVSAIRETASRALLVYSLTWFASREGHCLSSWPTDALTPLLSSRSAAALADYMDCQTFLYHYTRDSSYAKELRNMLDTAITAVLECRSTKILLCLPSSGIRFEVCLEQLPEVKNSLARACTFLARSSKDVTEARRFMQAVSLLTETQ